jgi:hypothetical protein
VGWRHEFSRTRGSEYVKYDSAGKRHSSITIGLRKAFKCISVSTNNIDTRSNLHHPIRTQPTIFVEIPQLS